MAFVSWVNLSGGSWETAGNWSNGGLGIVPGAGDDALINVQNFTITIGSGSNKSVGSVSTGGADHLIINGTLTTTETGSNIDTNAGAISIGDGRGLTVTQGTFSNSGTVYLDSSGDTTTFAVQNVVACKAVVVSTCCPTACRTATIIWSAPVSFQRSTMSTITSTATALSRTSNL